MVILRDVYETESALRRIAEGALYRFQDWPNPAVPRVAAGVYSVWRGGQLVYVGMAGRGLSAAEIERCRIESDESRGLASRLESHASGRRVGDPFCVRVADRLVLPLLSRVDIESIEDGRLSFDWKVREFIRGELSYRFAVVRDGREAHNLELLARAGALRSGVPILNPTRLIRAGFTPAQPAFSICADPP